jgi:hypothetical protein
MLRCLSQSLLLAGNLTLPIALHRVLIERREGCNLDAATPRFDDSLRHITVSIRSVLPHTLPLSSPLLYATPNPYPYPYLAIPTGALSCE